MAKRPYRILFVDDEQRDLDKFKGLLETNGGLVVDCMQPPQKMNIEEIFSRRPNLILIDYRLDKKATYRGLSLSGALRGDRPEIPIALLSFGSILAEHRVDRMQVISSGNCDEVLLKDEISRKNVKEVIGRLVNLIEGFQALKSKRKRDWHSLLIAIGAKRSEYGELLKASPPRITGGKFQWTEPEAARWVRMVLFEFPGILYDALHAATFLGIDTQSFLSTPVQEEFAACRYAGVFASEDGRWWKRRMLLRASEMMGAVGESGYQAMKFSVAWKKSRAARRITLKPSICVYSRESHADCVCHILKQPVMRRFSLPYLPDNRPEVMDEARVSFKAIRESNDFDETFVRVDARPLVREIQNRGE